MSLPEGVYLGFMVYFFVFISYHLKRYNRAALSYKHDPFNPFTYDELARHKTALQLNSAGFILSAICYVAVIMGWLT